MVRRNDNPMRDSRLQQALAALDDARTSIKDIMDEGLPDLYEHTLLTLAYDETNRAISGIKTVSS